MDLSELKRKAAEKAVSYVKSNMVVGLGTGSTAVFAVREIGRRLQDGRLDQIVGIPTSNATAQEAETWQIPLGTLSSHPHIDVAIDGADEISPTLDLIKGLGGALLREKIVATASSRFIIVADYTKTVEKLGTKAPVPVEVIPFAQRPVADYLSSLGAEVRLRPSGVANQPFVTDEDNIVLDCYFRDGIAQPPALAQAIRRQPGVVDHGLFLGMATLAIIASPDNIEIRQP